MFRGQCLGVRYADSHASPILCKATCTATRIGGPVHSADKPSPLLKPSNATSLLIPSQSLLVDALGSEHHSTASGKLKQSCLPRAPQNESPWGRRAYA